ncbi:hypothetical protein BC939DRAFT_279120 [Gamsiella multidivaricata]|uniref:uncharacterized protein n=1 Tax=Gamsiella multidivaricata TaxID=101098 RepID=UPI00221FAB89|nr:uncharacterized protein BC939DRAFT_279120 [Gamsiella multidivaricata]KAG0350867.1 hypothetical protein BGZ54_003594 [Gamsiella multidivaricata]KAI7830348.1 hypothetical protein BC939DRAFT_279120 [Gamsiella multidivaricata]
MDPRKLKVNELKEQLQLAGLSVNGKKEELVARLLEHQKAEEEAASAAGPPTDTGETFDWDESKFDVDDLAPPSDPVTATSAASAMTPAVAPSSTTTTTATTKAGPGKPTSAAGTSTTAPAAATTSTAEVASTAGTTSPVPASGSVQSQQTVNDSDVLKAEFEKRKNRAARFGIPLKEQDKAIERAARFGVPVPASAAASLAKATGTATSKAPASPKALPTKPASIASQIPADVLSKRQQRFGTQAPAAGGASGASAAKKPAQVLDPAEEEKKRKRAEKFGLNATTDEASKKAKV